ncbi:MAG: hypothetical protein ABIP62_03830, partial [Vicinamibacteria bacterium]
MTTHNGPEQARRLWRTLGIGFGLSLALLANLGDRAFSASAANAGIDPLQVLDTAIKNNILFMVGTSGTMGGTVQDGTAIVGGGDPASRFYQVKRALREVIAANAGKANFGLAAFHPDYNQHLIDGSQGLVYVTQDPTGDLYRNNFVGGTPVTYRDSCVAGTSCTNAESNDIFTELTSSDAGTSAAYPRGCTPQTTNQVAANGTVNLPITHVLGSPATNAEYAANALINIGSHCRYYVKSKSMLNSRRFQVFRGQGSTTAIRGSSTIACPPPPPGLVGDDVLAAADGSKARACFQVQDVTTGLMMSERGTALYSTTRSTTYTGAAAWTPAATTLLVAFVVGAGSVVDPTGVTGHGLTYTKVTLPANTISTTHAMSVWVAKAGASPTSAAASVTFAATALGAALVEYEVAGADLSGILPTAAIVQAVTSNGTGTVASTTLLAGSTANGVMYFVSHLAAEGATPNALWTEGSDGSFINP